MLVVAEVLVVDGLVRVHVALLLQNVQPLLHRIFVLDQGALVLLQAKSYLNTFIQT